MTPGGILSRGYIDWGDIVQWVKGGYCPVGEGYCPGGYCPWGILSEGILTGGRGDIVLSPFRYVVL